MLIRNETNVYDVDPHLAEIYDNTENYTNDVDFIKSLIGDRRPLRILEPFCGTGRILIPLAQDGHSIVGIDQAESMLARAEKRIGCLPKDVRQRIKLVRADATDENWPEGFDLVIIGGNSLYELATPDEQERCIEFASAALRPGGHVYVDNNHMEGELAESWQEVGTIRQAFPTGHCKDGTHVESTIETIWFDVPKRLVCFRRNALIRFPDGNSSEASYVQQKHPVSKGEVESWLNRHGVEVEAVYGDRDGNTYTDSSDRAIFWGRKISEC